MMMAHTDRLPACNKTYSGDNDDDDDIGDDNDDHVMKTLGTTSQITPIFSYASSSTLHPRQWVSGLVIVSTSVASRLASLFLLTRGSQKNS